MSNNSPLALHKYSWTESVLPVYPSGVFEKTCKAITESPPRAPVSAPSSKEFTLRQLPQVMRGVLKWPVSAAVMEKWFSLPAREFTNREKQGDDSPKDISPQFVDTKLITWAWLNRFERVLKAEAALIASLGSSNALKILDNRLSKKLHAWFKVAAGSSS
jgi:hypothetical protein